MSSVGTVAPRSASGLGRLSSKHRDRRWIYNVLILFVVYGLGNLGFSALLMLGSASAFAVFASIELILRVLAFAQFQSEPRVFASVVRSARLEKSRVKQHLRQ